MGDSVNEYYEQDPNARVWQEEGGERRKIGFFIGHCIAEEIPFPKASEGKKTLVLSVASNIGVMEQGIQEEAGNHFLVVANDFSNIPRVDGVTPLQSDARNLPFADNSVPCIVDIAGASWHQLADDIFNDILIYKKSGLAQKIINHYLSKLMPQGVLIIDDGYEKSTGQLLDQVFEGNRIDGFSEPIIIGEEPYKLRVYKKE